MSEPIISIKGLKKSFGGNHVLRGIDLDVAPGSITVVIGPSGCGKSVLIKHIIGLLRADEGRIVVDGDDITRMNERDLTRVRKKFGMLFQQAALFDSMTVLENVMFPLKEHSNMSRRQREEAAAARLDELGLHGTGNEYPAELSGGMRKRVGLARATILNPKIVIYDEPMTGLDPIMCENVEDMILTAQRRLKVTSVIVSHDMASTFRMADEVAMLFDGNIVVRGPPAAVKASRNDVVRRFIYLSGTGPRTIPEAAT
ncbi:MAG: ABC transporter ATP-binding protein [Deltaproteobacteria bacterium]|nr:ABC transporter ATP-binding protein [Deltaproteobacteria bacterium]